MMNRQSILIFEQFHVAFILQSITERENEIEWKLQVSLEVDPTFGIVKYSSDTYYLDIDETRKFLQFIKNAIDALANERIVNESSSFPSMHRTFNMEILKGQVYEDTSETGFIARFTVNKRDDHRIKMDTAVSVLGFLKIENAKRFLLDTTSLLENLI